MKALPLNFYRQKDVVKIAKGLLGKTLISAIGGKKTGGIIIETEAYGGITDRACHSYGGKKTHRTKSMYLSGGITYIYFCYGLHNMLNVVTNMKDKPEAVLIRAIYPQIGIDIMLKRRKKKNSSADLTQGPGCLCQALAITRKYNSHPLNTSPLWIEESKIIIKESEIEKTKRIGIDYAGKDAHRLWRFRITRHLIKALVS